MSGLAIVLPWKMEAVLLSWKMRIIAGITVSIQVQISSFL